MKLDTWAIKDEFKLSRIYGLSFISALAHAARLTLNGTFYYGWRPFTKFRNDGNRLFYAEIRAHQLHPAGKGLKK